MNIKKVITVIAGIGVIGGIAALFFVRIQDASEKKSELTVYSPATVSVLPVKKGRIRSWVSGEGTIRALKKEFLSFEATGKVVFIGNDQKRLPLREGSTVRGPSQPGDRGQLLAKLDDRTRIRVLKIREVELQAAEQSYQNAEEVVSQSKKRFHLARRQLERATKLYKKNLIPKSELETVESGLDDTRSAYNIAQVELKTARTQIEAIRQQIELAKLDIEQTRIFAPFDGIIAYLNIKQGDFAAPELIDRSSEHAHQLTAPIVVISKDEFELLLNIPSEEAHHVKQGQMAFINLSGRSIRTEKAIEPDKDSPMVAVGTVYSINPSINPGDRTSRIRIRTTHPSGHLKDGMFVTCFILAREKNNVIRIPIKSFVFSKENSYVFTVDPTTKTVHRQHLKTGIEGVEMIEVLSGLKVDDLLVLEGQKRLSDNERVVILDTETRYP